MRLEPDSDWLMSITRKNNQVTNNIFLFWHFPTHLSKKKKEETKQAMLIFAYLWQQFKKYWVCDYALSAGSMMTNRAVTDSADKDLSL